MNTRQYELNSLILPNSIMLHRKIKLLIYSEFVVKKITKNLLFKIFFCNFTAWKSNQTKINIQ